MQSGSRGRRVQYGSASRWNTLGNHHLLLIMGLAMFPVYNNANHLPNPNLPRVKALGYDDNKPERMQSSTVPDHCSTWDHPMDTENKDQVQPYELVQRRIGEQFRDFSYSLQRFRSCCCCERSPCKQEILTAGQDGRFLRRNGQVMPVMTCHAIVVQMNHHGHYYQGLLVKMYAQLRNMDLPMENVAENRVEAAYNHTSPKLGVDVSRNWWRVDSRVGVVDIPLAWMEVSVVTFLELDVWMTAELAVWREVPLLQNTIQQLELTSERSTCSPDYECKLITLPNHPALRLEKLVSEGLDVVEHIVTPAAWIILEEMGQHLAPAWTLDGCTVLVYAATCLTHPGGQRLLPGGLRRRRPHQAPRDEEEVVQHPPHTPFPAPIIAVAQPVVAPVALPNRLRERFALGQ